MSLKENIRHRQTHREERAGQDREGSQPQAKEREASEETNPPDGRLHLGLPASRSVRKEASVV